MALDKFLIILSVSLALLIGALLHTIHLLRKEKKSLVLKDRFSEEFINIVFNSLLADGIDIHKYATSAVDKLNKKKGGENNE